MKYARRVVEHLDLINNEMFEVGAPIIPGVTYDVGNKCVKFRTPEGWVTGWIGEWIVRDEAGHLGICTAARFSDLYTPIDTEKK